MTSAEWSVWATVVATAVTAIATGVLAWFTLVMARATRRMADATNAPLVVATLAPNRWSSMHLDLVIENSGTAPAFDVELEFDPPLELDREDAGVDDSPINRISVMRSGDLLNNWIGKSFDFLERDYVVTVSWLRKPKAKNRETIRYQLNLRHYKGLVTLGPGDPTVEIAREVKKIREGMERARR